MERDAKKERGTEKHSSSGISLDKGDLLELLVASHVPDKKQRDSWRPGKEIQLSQCLVRQDALLHDAIRGLVHYERYRERREGKKSGGGNLVLTPNRIDVTIKQAIETCGFTALTPLTNLFSQFPNSILSAKLLQNTSLGTRDRHGLLARKLNGMVLEVDLQNEKEAVALINKTKLPLKRGISVFALGGIDVERFIENFIDGEDLITQVLKLPQVKFVDFFYAPTGQIFLVIAGGDDGNLTFDPRSSMQQIGQDIGLLYQESADTRYNVGNQLSDEIKASDSELITSFPYVGLHIQGDTLYLVSGAALTDASFIFNSGPSSTAFLCDGSSSFPPIGVKEGNIVTSVRPTTNLLEGQVLTPVRNFGLAQ